MQSFWKILVNFSMLVFDHITRDSTKNDGRERNQNQRKSEDPADS